MTYITVPMTANNVDELTVQIALAKDAGAEMLEFRSDYFDQLDFQNLAHAIDQLVDSSLPYIVTCRDEKEGGLGSHNEDLRMSILCEAIKLGAPYIDCEFANYCKRDIRDKIDSALEQAPHCRLILSSHNFDGVYEDLQMIYESIVSLSPKAIPKIVYTALHINDCFDCFDLYHEVQGDLIAICMGKAGMITRVLAKKFGGFLTFASLDQDSQTANGQLTIKNLKELYKFDSIDSMTEIFGLIASPVEHSMSPAIHNSCFRKSGMNRLYLPLIVDGDSLELNEFLDFVVDRPWMDFRGFSVSIPHKANALEYLSQRGQYIEPLCAEIGAVNTLVLGYNGRLNGFNTDYKGALNALLSAQGCDASWLKGKNVAVVGAGGVARAIVAGLVSHNAIVTIFNRTISRAQNLAMEFHCASARLDHFAKLAQNSDIVINCTSVGMYPDVENCPIPPESITESMLVFDTIYNPIETRLLTSAIKAGAKTVSGVDMFISQAAEQFYHFTGKQADQELMRKTVFDWLC